MNTFEIKYKGDLRTTAIHIDSGSEISTDAPKDNHGLGETFSPTDMVCTALASCILTIMAIAVEKDNIDIKGTTAVVPLISTLSFSTAIAIIVSIQLARAVHTISVGEKVSPSP